VSRTTAQLEAEALAVPCAAHDVPAGAQCPDGGACMDRYGLSPLQWAGWFGDGASPMPFSGRPNPRHSKSRDPGTPLR
jgi:hypothetical protein